MKAEIESQDYQGLPSPSDNGKALRRRHSSRRVQPAKIGDLHVWTLKERVQVVLDGHIGIALETVNVVLSLVLVVTTIADSYQDIHEMIQEYRHFNAFEFVCTLFFAVDYALHWYAAPDRLRYMVTPMGIIDFITIVPTFLTFILISNLNAALPLLRMARIFRMLTVLRLYRIVQTYRGFDYQLGVLVFLLLALVLVAAGIFQILEEGYYSDESLDPLTFHKAMYFVFVTISTVGYGDISPHTTEGQFFVMFMIVVVITVIPKQVTRLLELSALQHRYMHSYALRRRNIHNGGHVVVTGHVRVENAAAFLREFYRPRQGRVNMDVVFLANGLPSPRLQALLLNVRYRRRTTYLKGNLLHDRDAKRAHVAEAAAVFILANRNDPRGAEVTDPLSTLQALAVDQLRFRASLEREHIDPPGVDCDGDDEDDNDVNDESAEQEQTFNKSQSRSIRCFTEILSLEHTRGLRTITGVEVALNTSQLHAAILARSIVCPGATALLLNLIYSPTERHVAQAQRSSTPWVVEYAGGLQNLLFPAVLPAYFDGLLFEDVAEKLYRYFQVMIIALYDRSAVLWGDKPIHLCPFGERLEENDLVFLIAPSSSVAKYAVDSLEERDRDFNDEHHVAFDNSPRVNTTTAMKAIPRTEPRERPTPALVFSSDSVLDRQSLQRDRRPSFELDERVDGVEASPPHHQELISNGSTSTCSTSPTIPTPRHQLHGHILICGPIEVGQQIACYLEELYTREGPPASLPRESGKRPTIVLLVKVIPDAKNLSELPPNVLVKCGESQNVEDLLRVRAYDAASVLLIPSSWDFDRVVAEDNREDLTEHLHDYQVIMSSHSLRTMQELHQEHIVQKERAAPSSSTAIAHRSSLRCSVVKSHESVKYFAYKSRGDCHALHDHSIRSDGDDLAFIKEISDNPHDEYHDEHFLHHGFHSPQHLFGWKRAIETRQMNADRLLPPCFAPTYAAGEVFVGCVLDTLLCQSFFNPYIVDLIRALTGDYYSEWTPHGTVQSDQVAFKASMMRYFSTIGSSSQETADDKKSLTDRRGSTCRYPVLRIATLSRELEGKTFAEIFSRALAQQVLVLGVYRRCEANGGGNLLPYVVTCPTSTCCRVEHGDQLHVLTKRSAPVCIQWLNY